MTHPADEEALDELRRLLRGANYHRQRAEAALARVRALHQPTGVVAAAEFGNPPDCTVCGPNIWPCPTIHALEQPERTTPNNPTTSKDQ